MSVHVAELGLAPGKSMRPQEVVNELRFDRNGLFDDREFMWVEATKRTNTIYHPGDIALPGQFLSQREDPALTQMVPEIGADDSLKLTWSETGASLRVPRAEESYRSRRSVNVWGWIGVGVDQGDVAADWG